MDPSAPTLSEPSTSPPPEELAGRLVGTPSPIAAVGFAKPLPDGISCLPDEPADESWGAVLLRLDDPFRSDLSSFLEGLRQRLREEGSLVIAVPDPGSRAEERAKGLPSVHQQGLRNLIRRLSNLGFSVLRGASTTAPGWRVVVARKDSFRIRSYRPGDEAVILDLFPSCFHTSRSLEHWRWKYAENPLGNGILSQAFDPEGRLAAHYAGYPVPYWYAEPGEPPRRFRALQMGDTMTDPRFRHAGRGRHGLLARTVRHFFAVHRDESFGFFYGFNTGPIQRFCEWFIGGTRVEPVGFWRRSAAGGMRASSRRYRVEHQPRPSASWDHLFRRVAPDYGFLVARDAAYLDWRYLRCPDPGFQILAARKWGRLVGWSIFRRRDDTLIWGDALFDPRHARSAAALLAAALEIPAFRGVSQIEAWFSLRPDWWRETLEELGFERTEEPNGLALMALPEAESRAVTQLQRLYYTMGDGDLF